MMLADMGAEVIKVE